MNNKQLQTGFEYFGLFVVPIALICRVNGGCLYIGRARDWPAPSHPDVFRRGLAYYILSDTDGEILWCDCSPGRREACCTGLLEFLDPEAADGTFKAIALETEKAGMNLPAAYQDKVPIQTLAEISSRAFAHSCDRADDRGKVTPAPAFDGKG